MKKSLLPFVSVVAAIGFSLLPILSSAQDPTKTPDPKKSEINFEKEIVPIVKASCIGCHNKDNAKQNVAFPDKMTLEDAKKNPRLWKRTARVVKSGQMPPKDHGTITDKEKKKLIQWVNDTFPTPPPTTGGGN